METTMCGARADFQTAGLNGVFAHFCRRGQKWVAPVRETSPCRLLKEMGPPEAIRSDPRPQARNGPCAAGGRQQRRKGQGDPCPLGYQSSGAFGVLRYSRGLPSASTSTVSPPE